MSQRENFKLFTPAGLKTYSLLKRKSKVSIRDFAKVFDPKNGFSKFLRSLPNFLAARDFKEFLALASRAKQRRAALIWALGAHGIKVGLNPVFIDLMERGWVTALALNGAGVIHDFEIAFCGQTSEDVEIQIKRGRFGMARETGEFLNEAIRRGAEEGRCLGESVARMIAQSRFPYKKLSLLAKAYSLNIPVTVHVAIGTDTIHFHPEASGKALGQTSLADFFLFSSLLAKLEGGGVFLNIGSAVILPEVFLKGVTLARNKGLKLEDFATAVFDFKQQYRPEENVTKRPLGPKGRGFYFIGHHELMIPLLAAGLKATEKSKIK